MAPSSEERKRAARAGFDAFAADPRDVVALLAEEVEVFSSPELANAGEFEGREGYLRWISPWVEAWQGLEMEVKEVTAVGDRHVLTEVHQTGHGRGGIEVSMEVAFLFEIRDDLLVAYLGLYPDRESALRDARTRESAETA